MCCFSRGFRGLRQFFIVISTFLALIAQSSSQEFIPSFENLPSYSLEELGALAAGQPVSSVSQSSSSSSAGSSRINPSPQPRSLDPSTRSHSEPAMQMEQCLIQPQEVTAGNEADLITPEIRDLARGLQYDPVKLYQFVRNRITFVPYHGLKKGAHLTLLEQSGNSEDQSALLVALLRASGYSPNYRTGGIQLPLDHACRWFGVDPEAVFARVSDEQILEVASSPTYTATDADAERRYIACFNVAFGKSGFPFVERILNGPGNLVAVGLPHTWVELTHEGTSYSLSPSLVDHQLAQSPSWAARMDWNRGALLNAAGGTVGPGFGTGKEWVQNLDQAALATKLEEFYANLADDLTENLDAIRSGFLLTPYETISVLFRSLAEVDTFTTIQTPFALAEAWTGTAIRSERMSELTLRIGVFNPVTGQMSVARRTLTTTFAALRGRKLSVEVDHLDAKIYYDEQKQGTDIRLFVGDVLTTNVNHKSYTLRLSSGSVQKTFSPSNQRQVPNTIRRNGDFHYAYAYGFDNPQRLLQIRQEKLAEFRRSNVPETSHQVRSEVLNIMGLEWYAQTYRMDQILGSVFQARSLTSHRVGRCGLEANYFIDINNQRGGFCHQEANANVERTMFNVSALFASAQEHGVLEQLQGPQAQAASTVAVLRRANEEGEKIYLLDAINWQNLENTVFQSHPDRNALDQHLDIGTGGNFGAKILVPESGNIPFGTPTPTWNGKGYACEQNGRVAMIVGGNLKGGFSVVPGGFEIDLISDWRTSSPAWTLPASSPLQMSFFPTTTPFLASIDPIDLRTGAYFLDKKDLVVDGEGAWGLNFSRHYNTQLRHDRTPGLGYGWTHSLHWRLSERSSTRACLGETNLHHAAPLITAATAAFWTYANHDSAKEWTTAALIADWGVSQMRQNALSISLGHRTIEFIKMPDGSYEEPSGMRVSLEKKEDGGYLLTERHRHQIHFDDEGKATELEDFSGQKKTFTYHPDGRLWRVRDQGGRYLTLNWINDRISSISDGTQRSVFFNYNSANQLTSSKDPDGHLWRYVYDAENRMTSLRDPANRLIAENDFDAASRVSRQRAKGDPTREWCYYWSGFVNTEVNPAGDVKSYHYDAAGRNIFVVNETLGEVTTSFYDGQDRMTRRILPSGQNERTTWNSQHDPLIKTDPLGNLSRYQYDSELRVEAMTDRRGHQSTITYDPRHLPLTTTNHLGEVTTRTYYPNGLLHTVTDPENRTTTLSYNSHGYLTKTTHPDGSETTASYHARGDLLSQTDEEGRTTAYSYDKRRNKRTTTLPPIAGQAPAILTQVYDSSNNLTSTTDARGHITTHTYDALRNQLTTTQPALASGGNILTTELDVRDWATATTNSLNHRTETLHDAEQRALEVTDPIGRKSKTTYDKSGRTTAIEDPLARINRTNYNARNEATSSFDAAGGETKFVFDAEGNRTRLTNRRGRYFDFTYDDVNRLTRVETPLGHQVTTTYFKDGLTKTIAEASGQTVTNTYDNRARLETVTDPTGTITTTYDQSNLPLTITEGGKVITRDYDNRARLTSFTTADGEELQYEYDASNNLTRLIYPDGKAVTYTYNARDLLTTVTDWAGRLTTYHYDRISRLIAIDHPNGTRCDLTYDAASQLLSVKESHQGSLFSYLRFTYDTAGQITERFRAPLIKSAYHPPTRDFAYDADNRILTLNGQNLIHDDDGNLTTGLLQVGASSVSLNYDSRNRLTGIPGTSYQYDAENRRLARIDGSRETRFTIDPNSSLSRCLVETHPDGTKTRYVYGLGLCYSVDEEEKITVHHYDQVGSTIVLTDDMGQVTGRAEYSPYGAFVWSSGDMETPFRYNGRTGVYTDPNGLICMRARYYSPYLMRFLNADPIRFEGGQNWYAYASGNPVSFIDPRGTVVESGWDVANVVIGAASLGYNLNQGNYWAAGVDVLGLAYDGTATAIPFLPAGVSAAMQARRAGNSMVESVQAGVDISNTTRHVDEVARNIQVSSTEIGWQAALDGSSIHREVAGRVGGRLGYFDSTYMAGANRSSGIQPDMIGGGIWADITTRGQWGAHVSLYAEDFGTGIPILYNRGFGASSFRLTGGASATVAGFRLVK